MLTRNKRSQSGSTTQQLTSNALLSFLVIGNCALHYGSSPRIRKSVRINGIPITENGLLSGNLAYGRSGGPWAGSSVSGYQHADFYPTPLRRKLNRDYWSGRFNARIGEQKNAL
jgi:hypothetical protein